MRISDWSSDVCSSDLVDSFAGGGGASTGIERALGRYVDVAVNHDGEALAMHEINHPRTAHIREDVWKINPRGALGGRQIGLLWASPDCNHFSKAKGGKRSEERRVGKGCGSTISSRWSPSASQKKHNGTHSN